MCRGNSTRLLQSGPGTHLWVLGDVYCNSLIGIVDTLAKIGVGRRMNTEVQDKGE